MNYYKGKAFFALLAVCLLLFMPVSVVAEVVQANQEIRVGLTELYSGKDTLTVYNQKIGYGYCVGNVFLQEAVLE